MVKMVVMVVVVVVMVVMVVVVVVMVVDMTSKWMVYFQLQFLYHHRTEETEQI